MTKIAIVGSGTSGLAAAAFLAKDGHDVRLFEKFTEVRPLGAGLMIQPTGLAVLAALGLDKKAIQYGAKIYSIHGQTATGRTIFNISYKNLRPHYFGLGIHRGALFSILYDEVKRLNVPMVTGIEIKATHEKDGKRFITDRTGREHGLFDLVIDASGMKSVLREGNSVEKYHKPYPYGAVWGVCEDPGQEFGKNLLQQRYDRAKIMIGMLSIGRRPSDNKEVVTFFWSLPVSTYKDWKEQGLEPWKLRVLGYWPELKPFLDQFKSVDDLTFARYSDTLLKRPYGDRIVFIGDSAHCTSPQLGQGANLGLIDALTLAKSLKETPDVNAALKNYAGARKYHTCFYQSASRWLTPFFQSDYTPLAWVRDLTFGLFCKTPFLKTEMLKTLAGIKNGPFTCLNPGQWHRDYDLNQPR